MDIKQIRRINLQKIIDEQFNGKRINLARAMGMDTGSSITRAMSDNPSGRGVGDEIARGAERAAGKPKGWLDQIHSANDGNIEIAGKIVEWDGENNSDSSFVPVSLYEEVELAAGNGSTAIEESATKPILFRRETLRDAGVEPDAAIAAKVSGNSMEPVLPHGSTIGINKLDKKIVDGKIYAFDHDGQLRVKVLYRKPGGLRVRSYNQAEFPEVVYTAEEMLDITILGRVFWSSVIHK